MSEPRRILVIEDDPDISRMLELNLRGEGFTVAVEPDGEKGLARLVRERYDLLVLDLMLPGIDGLHVCREVRRKPEYLPIVIVSAKSAEVHRVLGLELEMHGYTTPHGSTKQLARRA
jgi:DNA-binding response OmpR family regulator